MQQVIDTDQVSEKPNDPQEAQKGGKTQIIITLTKYQSEVEFTIIDQGVGIPKDELLTIFEPFTVGSRTRTRSGDIPGNISRGQRGIGLTLCKLAIEAHGGTIKAESNGTKGNGTKGNGTKGAKFSFSLPVVA